MKVIAVLGRKGGGGKTACSHLLSLSFGLAGYKPVLIQTDLRGSTPPMSAPGRPYWLFGLDASQPKQSSKTMQQVFDRAQKTDGSIVVLDGGANRDTIDEALAKRADLIIIPVADGPEDLEVGADDRKHMEDLLKDQGKAVPVRILLNRWPGRKAELEPFLKDEYVVDFMARTEGLRLATMVPRLRSAKTLLDHSNPESGPNVRKVGRQLLEEVTGLLKIPADYQG